MSGGHANAGAAGGGGHTGAVDVPKTADVRGAGAANQTAPTCARPADQAGSVAVGDDAGGANADQSAGTGIAFDAAGGVGVVDVTRGDGADQSARTGGAKDHASGVAVVDVAAGDGTDQATRASAACDAAGGVAVGNIAGGAAAQQAADRCRRTVVDVTGGVAVTDIAAGHGADQTAGAGRAVDVTGSVAVNDRAGAAAADQGTGAGTAGGIAAHQPDVLNHGPSASCTNQPDTGDASAVDDQVADAVAKSIHRSGKAGDGREAGVGIPSRRTCGVDVAAHRIVARHIAADTLQVGGAGAGCITQAVDHGERFSRAVRTLGGAEVLSGRQVDGRMDVVSCGVALRGGALTIEQCQAASAARGSDRLVDVDVAIGIQCQTVVGAPADSVVDGDVAQCSCGAAGSLNLDAVGG